jgi:hypothetical protein
MRAITLVEKEQFIKYPLSISCISNISFSVMANLISRQYELREILSEINKEKKENLYCTVYSVHVGAGNIQQSNNQLPPPMISADQATARHPFLCFGLGPKKI